MPPTRPPPRRPTPSGPTASLAPGSPAAPTPPGPPAASRRLPVARAAAVEPRVTIRVVLADDQDLVRVGLRALIDREPDMEVAGEAANGQQALDAIRSSPADVVVMDIRM